MDLSEPTLPQSEGYLESFDPELRRAFEFADQKVDPALIDHSKLKMHPKKLKLSGDAFFYTLQGEGPTLGFPAIFVRLHVCNLKCTWCLAPSTLITKADGSRVEIHTLQVGDKILDAEGNIAEIEHTQYTEVEEYYSIELEDGSTVECSGEHPFLVDGEWVQARDLAIGVELSTTAEAGTLPKYEDTMQRV